jgi:hypothetical protein
LGAFLQAVWCWSPHSPYCRQHRPSSEERARWERKPREARGYGAAHKAARARHAALVASGLATGARCGRPIAAGAPFDLDHSDDRARLPGCQPPPLQQDGGCSAGGGGDEREAGF